MGEQVDPHTEPLRAQESDEPAWILGGRYRVIDRLGRGGMSEVFRAHDELLDRNVAIKVFRSVVGDDADTNGEVRREMELQSLAKLSHPNLITLFDGSVAGDGPAYLVLELVEGPDLAARLREGPLPENEAREIGAQIADALAYVHAHGMVHRDVKPANILLGIDEGLTVPGMVRARLSDFGIVRMIGSARMTAADLTLGTASYVAPEQARGADVGPPADVYALGLLLIEALTGVRCFDGPIHEALAARLATSPTIPTHLPTPWPQLLAAMTLLDPAARPSAAEVARSLREGVAPAATPGLMSPPQPQAALPLAAAPLGAGVTGPLAAAGPTGLAAGATGPLAAAGATGLAAAATNALPVSAAVSDGRPAGSAGSAGSAEWPAASGPPPPVARPVSDFADSSGAVDAPEPRRSRGGLLLLAAAAFAALVIGGGYLLLGGTSHSPTGTPTIPSTPAGHSTGSHKARITQAADIHGASQTTTSQRPKPTKHASATATRTTAAAHTPSPRPSTRPASTSAPVSTSAPASPPPSATGSGGAVGAIGSPAPSGP